MRRNSPCWRNKSGATRWVRAELKFFELEARFPRREDVPRACGGVHGRAGQGRCALFASYDLVRAHDEYHRRRSEFHGSVGGRWATRAGSQTGFADICPMEIVADRLRSALLARCRDGEDRAAEDDPESERVPGAAEAMFERQLTETTMERLSAESVGSWRS